jgi:hypothetical protein
MSTTAARCYRIGLTCFSVLLFSLSVLHAQVITADILGTVADPSGTIVANATVTLRNTGTQVTQVMRSNTAGEYAFNLPAKGTVTLNAADRRGVNVTLTAGQNTQTIEVTTVPRNLGTDSSVSSMSVTAAPVQNLPLNRRDFVQLAQMTAGANECTARLSLQGNPCDYFE